MEGLQILEQKIAALIESKRQDLTTIAELKAENVRLAAENMSLKEQTDKIERSILSNHQGIESLNQERELTRMVVDDLIKSIDILVDTKESC
jgi:cell division protein FtsB